MDNLTIILIFLICLLCFIQYIFNYTPKAKLFNKIPGPTKIPIFGSIFYFLFPSVPLFYLLRHLSNKFKKTYSIQLCGIKVINIYTPEDFEIVLSSSKYIKKSAMYDLLRPWLNEGLLTSTGEKWQKRRKILTPAFHFNILKQFCITFAEQSQNLVENVKAQNSHVVSLVPLITQFAIDSICETAMGTQIKTEYKSKFEQYKDAIYEYAHLMIERIVRVWLHNEYVYSMTSMARRQKYLMEMLHSFTSTVINQRRKERESGEGVRIQENDIENDNYCIKSNKKRLAMLDLLLAAEADGRIDDDGIREEVDTFMFEGHDTTTMAISFSLMTLANNRKEQDKIFQELNDMFMDSDRPASIEDLNNMKYLELCIKECLRLYPSVHIITRVLEEDVQLTNHLIPAGTDCHMHIFDIHRDCKIYPNPDAFIPERFTQENSAKRHPFAYVPFSAGPRNCIGQKFAMYEMKSVISTILRNFILEPVTKPNDLYLSADIVLRSKYSIYVKFTPRY